MGLIPKFTVALALLLLSQISFAAPQIQVGSINGQKGATGVVPVSFVADAGQDFVSLKLTLQYDPAYLFIAAPSASDTAMQSRLLWSTPQAGQLQLILVPDSASPFGNC